MKKTLIVLLSVLTVVFMATAALAVEVSYEGEVSVKWSGETDKDPGFAEDAKEAKVTVDFTEDFGDGVTAGVETKVEAHGDKTFEFDSDGWIQLERDLFTAKASTGINGQAARDLNEYKISEAAGLGVDLNLVEGLTINTILNAGPDYGYLVKGEYADDLFTIGGGYQNDNTAKESAFGVYGTVNVIDGLAINAEFGSRNTATDVDDNEAIKAILASAAYDVDALSVTGTFLMQDAGFISLSDDDADQDWRIIEGLRFTGLGDATAVAVDASYDVTEDFVVDGYFDYLISVKIGDVEQDLEDNYAYKAGATYTLDALELAGWYKAAGSKNSQIGGKATYTLAEGVDTSLEVTSTTKKLESEDAKLAYTAKITAAL